MGSSESSRMSRVLWLAASCSGLGSVVQVYCWGCAEAPAETANSGSGAEGFHLHTGTLAKYLV